jgi:hypothetical protein
LSVRFRFGKDLKILIPTFGEKSKVAVKFLLASSFTIAIILSLNKYGKKIADPANKTNRMAMLKTYFFIRTVACLLMLVQVYNTKSIRNQYVGRFSSKF